MGVKRKRPPRKDAPNKRTQVVAVPKQVPESVHADHPVLKHYFDRVSTLREHLATELTDRGSNVAIVAKIRNQRDTAIARILDNVIVGYRINPNKTAFRERRAQDVTAFTQQLPSSTLGSTLDVNPTAQLEIIDFLIWLLFRRSHAPSRPQHLLAQGFDRLSARAKDGLDLAELPGIPGIVCKHSNAHVETVVSSAWCTLLKILGKGGDIVMVDLLLENCLFVTTNDNAKSLKQFSGMSSIILLSNSFLIPG